MKLSLCIEPRSMLFVPADAGRFLAKAATRGADVIVLDLEDGVAPSSKETARAALANHIPMLRACGAKVYVRVNSEPGVLERDLACLVASGVGGIVFPKVDAPEQLARLERWAADCNLPDDVGFVKTLPLMTALQQQPTLPAFKDAKINSRKPMASRRTLGGSAILLNALHSDDR
jgi:citrate lyase subunit beta/citryl-CoA lyase